MKPKRILGFGAKYFWNSKGILGFLKTIEVKGNKLGVFPQKIPKEFWGWGVKYSQNPKGILGFSSDPAALQELLCFPTPKLEFFPPQALFPPSPEPQMLNFGTMNPILGTQTPFLGHTNPHFWDNKTNSWDNKKTKFDFSPAAKPKTPPQPRKGRKSQIFTQRVPSQ